MSLVIDLPVKKIGIIAGVFVACLVSFNTVLALPFNQDMVGSQKSIGDIHRPEPANSIPRGFLDRNLIQGKLIKERGDALSLKNTVPADDRSIMHGERLYQTNCSVCHGRLIEGKHITGAMQKLNGALPLFANYMIPKPDAHFFQHVYFGLMGVMPSYKYRFSIDEHWDLVNYIRHGQKLVNK